MGMRILISNTWIYYEGEAREGYIYIDGEYVADIGFGKEYPVEYEFSELHYRFNGKAIVFRGYSYAYTPSRYPFRGSRVAMDYSIFTVDEIRSFIEASLYEQLMNGLTLPIIFGEKYLDILYDVIKLHRLKAIIVLDEGSDVRKFVDSSNFDTYTVSKKISREYNIEYIDSKSICRIDQVGVSECKILYIDEHYKPPYILQKLLAKGSNYLELLFSGYKLLSGDYELKEKSPSDLIIYKLDKLIHTPLIRRDPLSIIVRSYKPDIVIYDGEVVVEEDNNYVFTEASILKNLRLII